MISLDEFMSLPTTEWSGRFILHTMYGWVETNRTFTHVGKNITPALGDAIETRDAMRFRQQRAKTLTTAGRVRSSDSGGMLCYAWS